MQEFLIHFAYLGIVVALVGRGVGLPLPEDVSLLTIGFLCAGGVVRLDVVLPLAWVCIVLADTLSFWGGRLFGHHLPRFPLLRWVITHAHLAETEAFYQRHGVKALVVARMLPGLRSPMFFVAGASKVSFSQFFFIDAAIAPLNVAVLVLLGRAFPANLAALNETVGTVQLVVGVLAALVIGVWLVRRHRKRRRVQAR